MSMQEDKELSKPASQQSNVPKKPYPYRGVYSPSWMSPKERYKLKARIMKIKKQEETWVMKKEDEKLIQKSPGRETQSIQRESIRAEDVMKRNDSTILENEDNASFGHHPSAISKESSLQGQNTPKKGKAKKQSKSRKSSKDSLSKKKSKDELAMAKKPKEKHPKADHANPSGNVVEDEHPWTPHPRDNIEAHLWATDYRHFDPQLYAFKTPEKLSTKKPVVAECPPFWVLNDHTIAVAWKLFCKDADRSDLGIVALQWSREFVCAMKDERGEYPGAIKHLLDAIEDGLIFRYSRAAEDSKKAHQKDDISYASSDSVFKPPTEVSYTLKDILSRNFPGRKFGDDHEASIVRKDGSNASAVNKSALLPLSVLSDGEGMKPTDLIALLKQCKIEQEARIKHEMNASREIEQLLKLAQDGKLPIQTERKDHVGFDVPESEPLLASSRPKKLKKDADLKNAKSDTSNKSTKSDASRKSGKSAASGTSEKSRASSESLGSVGSAISSASSPSMDSNASAHANAMQRKKSKDKVGRKKSKDSLNQKSDKKKSKGNFKKKRSKDSLSSRKSQGSTSSKKKGSKGSKGSKRESRTSRGSNAPV